MYYYHIISTTLTTISKNNLTINELLEINKSVHEYYNDAIFNVWLIIGIAGFIITIIVPILYYRFQKQNFQDYVKNTKEDIIKEFDDKVDSMYEDKINEIESENEVSLNKKFYSYETQYRKFETEMKKKLDEEVIKAKYKAKADLLNFKAEFYKMTDENNKILECYISSLYYYLLINEIEEALKTINSLSKVKINFAENVFNKVFILPNEYSSYNDLEEKLKTMNRENKISEPTYFKIRDILKEKRKASKEFNNQ